MFFGSHETLSNNDYIGKHTNNLVFENVSTVTSKITVTEIITRLGSGVLLGNPGDFVTFVLYSQTSPVAQIVPVVGVSVTIKPNEFCNIVTLCQEIPACTTLAIKVLLNGTITSIPGASISIKYHI